MYALIIALSGILIGTKFAVFVMAVVVTSIVSLGVLQANQTLIPDTYWKLDRITKADAWEYAIAISIIMILVFLYNLQVEKSLKRARRSEKALKKERDLLEVKVNERTRDLKSEQSKRISQLYHFYEFGQLSGGIFHDLVNRLQSVYFSIEELSSKHMNNGKVPADVKEIIDEANSNFENVRTYLRAAQKQIRREDTRAYFSIVEEIKDCVEVSSYRVKQSGASIYFSEPNTKIVTFGNKFKLNQILTNLIGNAADSCSKIKDNNIPCSILIEAKKIDNNVVISINDSGVGIKKENLKKIFDPFFTTNKTMGLGLYTTKNIIEKDFKGKIKVGSKHKEGASVIITIPLIHK